MTDEIETRLTRRLGIRHPILLAPMDVVADGRLGAAVTAAGGLGLIGGGYGETGWVDRAFREAGNQRVGIGFITWSLRRTAGLFERVLEHRPQAVMFSFGDAEDLVARCREAGIVTLWQVQRLAQARQALAAGTDIIVVQGQEAGGHGMDRGLMSLLPAVRDAAGEDQVIVAAGGIADGRGLAAALMLGADGVLMGTRFYACTEAAGSERAKRILVETSGDDTLRGKVFDIARGVDWPRQFTGRVVENDFARQWRNDLAGLEHAAAQERARYATAGPEDYSVRAVIAGESLDLIGDILPAGEIMERTVSEAARLLGTANRMVGPRTSITAM